LDYFDSANWQDAEVNYMKMITFDFSDTASSKDAEPVFLMRIGIWKQSFTDEADPPAVFRTLFRDQPNFELLEGTLIEWTDYDDVIALCVINGEATIVRTLCVKTTAYVDYNIGIEVDFFGKEAFDLQTYFKGDMQGLQNRSHFGLQAFPYELDSSQIKSAKSQEDLVVSTYYAVVEGFRDSYSKDKDVTISDFSL
jgi:hypothetical protein